MPAKKTELSARGLPASYVPIEELYLAYRKAKVDTFYERELCISFEFVEFEEKLQQNLETIRGMLETAQWINDPKILGGLSFIPKSLDFDKTKKETKAEQGFDCKTIQTVPSRSWIERLKTERRKDRLPVATFRPIAKPSVAWLVISALWIMKAGHKLDACLGDCARGSRLRTHKDGKFNNSAHGSFAPYAPAYGAWREDGLRTVRHELDEGRGCIGITADLRSFYHSVDPGFLNDSRFIGLIRKIEVEWDDAHPDEPMDVMGPLDWRFTAQMAASYKAWAQLNKELLPGKKAIGLPIGPGAARVIANLTMIGFDRFIEHELQPLYYGRYVDDVFLVLRDGTGATTGAEVWRRIQKLSEFAENSLCQVKLAEESGEVDEKVYRLHLDYDQDGKSGVPRSDLRFAGKKQKIFFIEGAGGNALIEAIEEQIRATSSEWRQLPEPPSNDGAFQDDFMSANPDATEPADNLRKADKVSIRRMKFAFHLRDLEAFAEDLTPKEWVTARRRLYEFTETQLLVLPEFFVYATYLPRIFGIAAHARDWKESQRLVRRIAALFKNIKKDCGTWLDSEHLKLCQQDLGAKLTLAICRSLPIDSQKSTGSHQEFQTSKHCCTRSSNDPISLARAFPQPTRTGPENSSIMTLAASRFDNWCSMAD